MPRISIRHRAILLLQAGALIALSGCAVTSDHPVSQLEDSEPIPEYLQGSWDFVKIVGRRTVNRDGEVILDVNVDGSLRFLMREEGEMVETNASLTTIGDLKVFSIAPKEGETSWGFASVVFDEATQELTINFLGHAELTRDIGLGLLDGEVYEFGRRELAHLTASPDALRGYFAARPEAFSDDVLVLKKRPEEE